MNSIMCFSRGAQITNQASPTAFQFVYMVLAIELMGVALVAKCIHGNLQSYAT